MAKRTTLYDVAAAAGVSAQTVSRVVNDRPNVAKDTRRRVWETVRRLSYRPSSIARSLASSRTKTLGLVTSTLDYTGNNAVIAGVERKARSLGYTLLLTVSSSQLGGFPRVLDLLLERQVDGILTFHQLVSDSNLGEIPVPTVSLTYPVKTSQAILVQQDYTEGVYEVVSYLTGLGHRRLGMIAVPEGWYASAPSMEGARRALAEIGQTLDQDWVQSSMDCTPEAGYECARALLQRHPDLTALFCQSDALALGAYRALHEAGRRIPDHVSVVGYHDFGLCRFAVPSLTTVRTPKGELGDLLVQLLVHAIEEGSVSQRHVLVPGELIVRESTAPAPTT